MAKTGEYGTVASPSTALGYLVQAGSRVEVGKSALYESLETTSDTYTAYEASIGLKDGQYVDLGELESLETSINATVEPFDSVNLRLPSIYYVTEEEATITTGLTQWDYNVLETLFHNGVLYELSDAANPEKLITFGGACNIKNVPMSIGIENLQCYLPESQSVELGLTGIILTFYDVISTSGFNPTLSANEINTVEVEWMARPVLPRSSGNQLGNMYIF